MIKKGLAVLPVTLLLIAAVLVGAPSIGQADVIISTVTAQTTFTTLPLITGCAALPCTRTYANTMPPDNNPNGTTWNFTGGTITLAPGQSLVLTQNQADQGNSSLNTGLPGFNFDTSEANAGRAANPYTVTVNGTSFADNGGTGGNGVLNDNGNDNPSSTANNEAANWVKIGGVAGKYDVYVGYADTLHSNACNDGPSGNCLPFIAGTTGVSNIWDGSGGTSTAATFFLGNPTNIPGYTTGAGTTSHCDVEQTNSALWNCWDAGAILIVNTEVPEPSTVLLVGTLIVGLIAISLRRARQGAAAA
jgi:hypothetical protein